MKKVLKFKKPIAKLKKEDYGYTLDHSVSAIRKANQKGVFFKSKKSAK